MRFHSETPKLFPPAPGPGAPGGGVLRSKAVTRTRTALRLGTAGVCAYEAWEILAHRKWTVSHLTHVARNNRLGSCVVGIVLGGLGYHLLVEAD